MWFIIIARRCSYDRSQETLSRTAVRIVYIHCQESLFVCYPPSTRKIAGSASYYLHSNVFEPIIIQDQLSSPPFSHSKRKRWKKNITLPPSSPSSSFSPPDLERRMDKSEIRIFPLHILTSFFLSLFFFTG